MEEIQGPSASGTDTLTLCYADLQKGTVAMEEHSCFYCDVLLHFELLQVLRIVTVLSVEA